MAIRKSKSNGVREYFSEKIKKGVFLPGDRLPSENEIASEFNIARQTVNKALCQLEDEGLIYKVQGSGSFVTGTVQKERNFRFAVITTYLSIYIFPNILRSIEERLFEANCSVQFAFTNNKIAKERAILLSIIEKNDVDGIIVETTKSGIPNPNIDLFNQIKNCGIKLIFINSYYKELDVPYISLDDFDAGKKVTQYLIEKGHQSIGGIFKLDDGQGHLRYKGYTSALVDKGITVEDEKIIWFDTYDLSSFDYIIDKILYRLKSCTAVVCYNDELAMILVEHLLHKNIRVPEDISIISIDNTKLATIGKVRLTSLENPLKELGYKAVDYILKMTNGVNCLESYEFKGQICERDSVKDINHYDNKEK